MYVVRSVPVSADAAAAPTEGRTAISFNKQVGHHARVAPVAIRVSVNLRQPVMQPHSDFVGRVSFLIDPVALHCRRDDWHFRRHQVRGDSHVEFVLLECARPFPVFAEHLRMQRLEEIFIEQICSALMPRRTAGPRPWP